MRDRSPGSNIIELQKHQFANLRQQMRPVYAILLSNRDADISSKHTILQFTLRTFFIRLREFRNLTKDQFAEAAKLTLEDVENFEDESLEFNGDIAEKYARICQAHSELSILEDQIKEFKNPGFFESRRSVAHSALKQMGIVMPGVDYSNLNCASAQVLPMRGFRKNENSFKAKE